MLFLKQYFTFLIIVVIISFADYLYVDTGTIGIDDGNIFLNYAHHIAHGNGFVFNTNGEKVEGFTSLLWVLICAAFYLVTSSPEILIICFCAVLVALTITIVYRNVKNSIQQLHSNFSKYFFWIYCAFIICIGPSFISWSVLSLMETALWNFIFTSIIILVIQTIKQDDISITKKIAIVLLGCALSITRPEALAWNLIFILILTWSCFQNKRNFFLPIIYFISVACVTAGLTIFRLRYFGFRFPNTYYAKVSPDKIYNLVEGLKYAFSFLTGYQALITFLFVLMVIMLLYNLPKISLFKRNNTAILNDDFVIKQCCVITTIILAGFILPCITGGDHFGGFRFYQDLLLLFAFGFVMIVWLLNYYWLNKISGKFLLLSIIILFFGLIGLNDLIDLKNPSKTQMNFEYFLAKEGRDVAQQLNNALAANKPSVGMIAVGGFALKYDGTTVDLMGLSNVLMGHSPGDRKGIKNHAAFNKDVFYKLNPDIILPAKAADINDATIKYYNLLDENNFYNEALKNIFNDAIFQKRYLPVFIAGRKNAGLFLFVNNNYINLLMKNQHLTTQMIKTS